MMARGGRMMAREWRRSARCKRATSWPNLTPMRRRFLFWGFKSSYEVLENSLGSLERDVMALVWQCGETNVRDACEQLGSAVAYTTVMTTMDRLFKKGLLARRKVGRAFVYHATPSRAEVEGAVATELVHRLLPRD